MRSSGPAESEVHDFHIPVLVENVLPVDLDLASDWDFGIPSVIVARRDAGTVIR